MRRAAKVDESQAAIVAALRECGCSVLILSGIGERAAPDLLVGYNAPEGPRNVLLEVKTPGRDKHDLGHWREQQEWRLLWRGPVATVHDASEALRLVGVEVQ